MNPKVTSPKPCIDCAVCGARRVKWFASGHVYLPSERKQLFLDGASLWSQPATLVAPVCSPECADELITRFDCPVYDGTLPHPIELHNWLRKWREQRQPRRAA